jgi:hypothetical protein
MNKLHELSKYSDIDEVNRRAYNLGLNQIHPSSRKDKKYMVFDGNKMQHFGQMFYEDATHHKNIKRINNFKNRNKKWATAPRYSPAFLSYYLLW